MLLPQPRRKPGRTSSTPHLETPEEVKRSEEFDQALVSRARRRQEEVAADRARFELNRDRTIFGFELVLVALVVAVGAVALAKGSELMPLVMLGGGGVGGVAAIVKRRPEA
ncbi:MAG TPA: hypothetical protein VLK37_08685 [Solirubrobacterales bacterium]|nr:hypothetical protein [Solirubrobacterales bacterium]